VVVIWGWYELRGYDLTTGKELWCYPIERQAGCEVVATMLADGDRLYLPHVFKFRALSLSKLAAKQDPLIWVTDMDSRGPNSPSPVLGNGRIFATSETKGYITCLDAATGKILWRHKVRTPMTLASLLLVGDKVYVSHTNGVTHVFRDSNKPEVIATNDLKEKLYASPAYADGKLFLRTLHHVWCVGAKDRTKSQ